MRTHPDILASIVNSVTTRREALRTVRAEADYLIEQLSRRARGYDKGPYRDDDTIRLCTIARSTRDSVSLAFALSRKFS